MCCAKSAICNERETIFWRWSGTFKAFATVWHFRFVICSSWLHSVGEMSHSSYRIIHKWLQHIILLISILPAEFVSKWNQLRNIRLYWLLICQNYRQHLDPTFCFMNQNHSNESRKQCSPPMMSFAIFAVLFCNVYKVLSCGIYRDWAYLIVLCVLALRLCIWLCCMYLHLFSVFVSCYMNFVHVSWNYNVWFLITFSCVLSIK